MTEPGITPRVLRLRDAPHYLGMDRNRFNELVRPHLTEVRYGKQSVGFDRLEMDAWFDRYKADHGVPAGDRKRGFYPGSPSKDYSFSSKDQDSQKRFEDAVERALAKRRKR